MDWNNLCCFRIRCNCGNTTAKTTLHAKTTVLRNLCHTNRKRLRTHKTDVWRSKLTLRCTKPMFWFTKTMFWCTKVHETYVYCTNPTLWQPKSLCNACCREIIAVRVMQIAVCVMQIAVRVMCPEQDGHVRWGTKFRQNWIEHKWRWYERLTYHMVTHDMSSRGRRTTWENNMRWLFELKPCVHNA